MENKVKNKNLNGGKLEHQSKRSLTNRTCLKHGWCIPAYAMDLPA